MKKEEPILSFPSLKKKEFPEVALRLYATSTLIWSPQTKLQASSNQRKPVLEITKQKRVNYTYLQVQLQQLRPKLCQVGFRTASLRGGSRDFKGYYNRILPEGFLLFAWVLHIEFYKRYKRKKKEKREKYDCRKFFKKIIFNRQRFQRKN